MVDVSAERMIMEKTKKYTKDAVSDKKELVSPIQPLEGQSLVRDSNAPSELGPRSDWIEAINLRVQKQYQQAYLLVKSSEAVEC